MLIDTHCHLGKEDYENIDLVIKKMDKNLLVASAVDLDTAREVLELCNKYENVFGTIGYHPNEINKFDDKGLNIMEQFLSNPKIVGVGEIGLDYHYGNEDKIRQKEIFIKQIELAKKYNKAIVIHSRDSAQDTYNILKDLNLDNMRIIMHCYSYSLEMAKKFIDLGIKLGIGGTLTFKNNIKQREIIDQLSLENFVLETDSPYLSPEPFRGIKNEPFNVIYVAQKIADIKGITVDEVERKTTENALECFNLSI